MPKQYTTGNLLFKTDVVRHHLLICGLCVICMKPICDNLKLEQNTRVNEYFKP